MKSELPFAELYEARYDVVGALAHGSIDVDRPVKTARIVASSFVHATNIAERIRAAMRGSLANELELRDVRLVETNLIVSVE